MKSIFFSGEDLNFVTKIDSKNLSENLMKCMKDLKLDPSYGVETAYPMKIPYDFISSIDEKDFIRVMSQFIPSELETVTSPVSSEDPLKESSFEVYQGVLKKYQSRVLIHLTSDCFCNCRFCFRRFTRRLNSVGKKNFDEYLKWIDGVTSFIEEDESIKEVILSGGDPFILSDEVLNYIFGKLIKINQLKTIRIHTRSLCVYPKRLTKELENLICQVQKEKNVIIVFHVNHETECNDSMKKIAEHILCYSQTVLLKGVNDSTKQLSKLFYKLISCKITPYYLHSLDHVEGAMHFEVDRNKGKQLIDEIRQTHPGYMIPRYVQETVDAPYKTLII